MYNVKKRPQYPMLAISLDVGSFPKNSEISLDEKAEYRPHNGGVASTYGRIFPHEVILAHETAHADAFFSILLPYFSSVLCYLDESLPEDQICAEVLRLYGEAVVACNPFSFDWADAATRSAFQSLGWVNIISSPTQEVWKKQE